MSASAPEFVPPVSFSLNTFASEFIPPEHKLMNKAAEMQKLLLECYTDDESSDSDEDKPLSATQKRKQGTKNNSVAVRPFRPPPGLAPPDAGLNPFAAAFDPSNCNANEQKSQAHAFTSVINFSGFLSEDEDESCAST